MKDPGTFLAGLGVGLNSALSTGKPAVLDSLHQSWVNYEAYFFATDEERARFDADPTRWCGFVTDPVLRKRFRPSKDSPGMTYRDRVFFFAADSTRATFAMHPDSLFIPTLRMIPRS